MDFNVSSIADVASSMYTTLKTVVNIVLPIIIGVVLLIGLIYSIYLGIKYAKAEEADDRNKQKQHLVGAVTGFAITLVLIAIINVVLAVVVDNKIKAQQDELNTAIAAVQSNSNDKTKTFYESYDADEGAHKKDSIKNLSIDGVEFFKDGTQKVSFNNEVVISTYTVTFGGIVGLNNDNIPTVTGDTINVMLKYKGTDCSVVVAKK